MKPFHPPVTFDNKPVRFTLHHIFQATKCPVEIHVSYFGHESARALELKLCRLNLGILANGGEGRSYG